MSEAPKPKQIFLVNWKQHKLDLARKQINEISKEFLDDVIFETVIDFCRSEYGFPGALPLREIIVSEPAIPNCPKTLGQPTFGQVQQERSFQTCPVCQQSNDARLYTAHLESCFKKPNCKPLEIATQLAKKEE